MAVLSRMDQLVERASELEERTRVLDAEAAALLERVKGVEAERDRYREALERIVREPGASVGATEHILTLVNIALAALDGKVDEHGERGEKEDRDHFEPWQKPKGFWWAVQRAFCHIGVHHWYYDPGDPCEACGRLTGRSQ